MRFLKIKRNQNGEIFIYKARHVTPKNMVLIIQKIFIKTAFVIGDMRTFLYINSKGLKSPDNKTKFTCLKRPITYKIIRKIMV